MLNIQYHKKSKIKKKKLTLSNLVKTLSNLVKVHKPCASKAANIPQKKTRIGPGI